MKQIRCAVLCFLFCTNFYAQKNATSASEIEQSLISLRQMKEGSLVKNIPFKNIGPSVMSGRVVDVDVNPENTVEFYVGYASGGLWYTNNNGTTFTSIMDNAETINVGDIAVDWKRNIIWVGTGENNASRSSYSGIGILKSKDKGKTWERMGLSDSQHIGRIILNPENENEVVIGVTGHLYSPNKERGIYKTTDGGKTWKNTLFIDERTGIIDLQYAPDNFSVQYASAWDKDRKAWNFEGNGKSSAIYKSTDSGETWTKVSTPDSGFPTGNGVGRIGLAVFDANIIYAVHDSQFRREKKKEAEQDGKLQKEEFKTISKEDFLKLDNKKLDKFLKTNGFQEKYRAENVKQLVRSGSIKPADLASYLEDANALLFDTPVVGAEVYLSENGGKTWKKTHKDYLDDIFYSYGYYFAQVQVNPKNKEHIYISGVPILKSKDGGKSFTSISAENVHADHHALWINPQNPDHLVNGNDGGVNITYDDGANWIKANQPNVGQFYAINVDNQEPYQVYGGLQDNGVWVGPNDGGQEDKSWHQSGHYAWKSIMGGDGMQVQIDNRDSNIVYTGYQFGNYYRLDREKGTQTYIQPKHELGETPYRFNWQTPILLSSHNQDILYLGGNKLMRSMNQGDDWTAISQDLTAGGKKGNVAYGTLTTLSESPFQFGLIYAGSDDGLVHLTKDSGGSWQNISNGLPKDLWASRIVASQHQKERVYVSLNGYRWDDFKPYVYASEDFGKTWNPLHTNLPLSPVNVIKEDPESEQILYVGTDLGTFVSLDRGKTWQPFEKGLPPVAVHDLVIHPETKDLLIGTHGRSIYKTNVKPLQAFIALTELPEIKVFEISEAKHRNNWGNSWSKWLEPSTPEIQIPFYANSPGKLNLEILSEDGALLYKNDKEVIKGFDYLTYDLSLTEKGKKALLKEFPDEEITEKKNGKFYLPVGKYTVSVSLLGKKDSAELVVK